MNSKPRDRQTDRTEVRSGKVSEKAKGGGYGDAKAAAIRTRKGKASKKKRGSGQ